MKKALFVSAFVTTFLFSCSHSGNDEPIRVITEMDIDELKEITLSNGSKVALELLGITVRRDSLRNAVRSAEVKVRVDGEEVTLGCGNYNLPAAVGKVQIDCPVVRDYYSNSNADRWGLTKDARFRLWPGESAFMEPGTFVYPVRQRWFASMTQSGNEPPYVDWGEDPGSKNIYYHSGHDIGGAEGMDEIVAAMDGLVVSARGDTLEGYVDFPGDIRKDVIWIVNDWGWFMRYSHLDSTDPAVQPGTRVRAGQRIGFMGKQGHSGGWVHLHFEMKHRETVSGAWGTEEAYAYLWEAYVNQYKPNLIAVARPHRLLLTDQKTRLDGSKSRSIHGDVSSYEWILSDGTTCMGAVVERSYKDPGEYSEILKVTDSGGNVDYDFMVLQVYDRADTDQRIPVLQPAYHPTLGITPGDTITFLVRSFNVWTGFEIWDFGDGSSPDSVRSVPAEREDPTKGKFAETAHAFEAPGDYIVTVRRSNEEGIGATAHLHVKVEE